MEFGIEKCAMQTIKSCGGGEMEISTAKPGKHQNAWRKEKLQVLENIGSKHHQTNWDEKRKKKKRPPPHKTAPQNKKTFWKQVPRKKTHQRNKHMWNPPYKLLWTILKMEKGRTRLNEPKDKEIDDYAQGFTLERWHRQTIHVTKKRKQTLYHWGFYFVWFMAYQPLLVN